MFDDKERNIAIFVAIYIFAHILLSAIVAPVAVAWSLGIQFALLLILGFFSL